MKKYRFESLGIEVTDPIIKNVFASYTIGMDSVILIVELKSKDISFNVALDEMPNTNYWGDDEVMDFALQQLEKYKI
jgi:hypothetical protein